MTIFDTKQSNHNKYPQSVRDNKYGLQDSLREYNFGLQWLKTVNIKSRHMKACSAGHKTIIPKHGLRFQVGLAHESLFEGGNGTFKMTVITVQIAKQQAKI